jgi:hypothetical protein
MHPVGMAPTSVRVPDGWPLEQGLVTCATCHSEPAHGGAAATLPVPWHRGGPYERITGLCYQCHDVAQYTREDPHHPATSRDTADPTCSACHTGVPQTGVPAEAARLRLPTAEACVTCHAGDVHAGAAEHLGHTVDAGATTGLVFVNGNEIACWTCHEVHGTPAQRSSPDDAPPEAFRRLALANEWAAWAEPDLLWPGSSDAAHPPLLALPTNDDALCRACHGAGP